MVLGRRHWIFVILPLILLMLLTACERPLASNDSETAEQEAEATAVAESAEAESSAEEDNATEEESAEEPVASDEEATEEEAAESETAEEAESEDPNVGGGTPETAQEEEAAAEDADQDAAEETTSEEATAEDAEADEATSGQEATEETTSEEASAEESSDESDETTTEDAAAEASADSTGEDTAAETAESEEAASEGDAMADEQDAAAQSTTLPATHTVAPGENLYRIGLKYGMSWVTLAAYNNLPNADYIRVGQVLHIPGGGTPTPTPPLPTPPDESGYTNYVVQRGDTLNKIARKFGVSWVEIAEANGIMNPNLIYAGQVLKIPISGPETPPAATHTVKKGETLYRISLQYGVHWLSIAQANMIVPPYVIYPGQVLAIPSG